MLNTVWDFFKRCWKGVITLVGVMAIITALSTFRSTFATSAELEQLKVETRQEIVQVKNEFQKSMELDRNLSRMNWINENITRVRLLLYSRPRDKFLIDEYNSLKAEKAKVQ